MMHVGIIIGDATEAAKFYTDILGLKEFWRGSANNAKTVSWLNMRLPESQDYVEFMLYSDLPAPTARGLQHHIASKFPVLTKLWRNSKRVRFAKIIRVRWKSELTLIVVASSIFLILMERALN